MVLLCIFNYVDMEDFTFENFIIYADPSTLAQFEREHKRFGENMTDIEYFNKTKDYWENPDALRTIYNQITGKTQPDYICKCGYHKSSCICHLLDKNNNQPNTSNQFDGLGVKTDHQGFLIV